MKKIRCGGLVVPLGKGLEWQGKEAVIYSAVNWEPSTVSEQELSQIFVLRKLVRESRKRGWGRAGLEAGLLPQQCTSGVRELKCNCRRNEGIWWMQETPRKRNDWRPGSSPDAQSKWKKQFTERYIQYDLICTINRESMLLYGGLEKPERIREKLWTVGIYK